MIWDKIFDKNNNSSQWMLKMVTSYSLFLLVILFLCFYLYISEMRNIQNVYNIQEQSTLLSNAELFEKDLNIMNIYCRQLMQTDDFRKIAEKKTTHVPFVAMGNELKTKLATDVYPESLLPIEEVFCYFPNTGYVLSPNYFISQNRYYDWIKRYAASEYENWLKALTTPSSHYRFLSLDNIAPNYTEKYYMYVINIADLSYKNIDAVVCFIFNEKELQNLFGYADSDYDDSFLIITDKSNSPVFTLGNNDFYSFEEITSLSGTFSNYHYNGYNSTVCKYISDTTGYTYYYSFPTFETSSAISGQQTLFILIFILALLGGIVLIFVFSKRNVEPIIQLDHELHEAVEAQNHLQEVVDNQRPIICNSYVRQLLSGSVTSEEEIDYIREYLDLIGEHLYYNGIYICVYNNTNETPGTSSKDYYTSEEFDSIVSEALQAYFGLPLYCFSPTDRTYAILLACPESDEKDFIFKIHDIIVKLHHHLLDTYGIWLFAGIGKNTDSLMNVWESYQQAVEAVNYTSKNYFYFPYEFIKKDSNAFYYPPEISTKLIHFITTGNKPQVLELFNLIHQENIEERSLPINLVKFLLSDIRNTLLKARFALPATVSEDTAKSLDERFNEHATFKLCEDIALTLCELFSVKTEDSNLISTIEKYIAENYMDPAMGLNKISDEFQISESYFSHMFKEKTGVNFSSYLENIRMNEAARLIKESDISLNELYISVGYNNANTFRRAFKKIYGITPSNMRDNK